jgi:2-polyprenyl-3-methyl-5-hydroxy-6-metoxy-1,4-benzoquinol methylase
MQPTSDSATLSPELFWQTITAFQRSAAMKAAVELDVFTRIDEGNRTARAIADASRAAERGIRILCDTLTVMQFLTKDADGQYDLNETSRAFLSRKSQTFIGDTVNFIMSPMQQRGFNDLTEAVRRGGSTVRDEGSLDPESPMWVTFARSMAPMMMPAAQMLADNLDFPTDRKIKVLDIAAGHGIFGILVARRFPNAEIYAVDWANVLTVATENARKFGVADRHHLIPGSAFDVEYGDGYDAVLLANFLHHFDQPTNERLLRKIHQSLSDDGKVLTLEFVPNDDRVSPPSEAMFSLVMLAATPAGDAYTFAELREMFENAGFSRNRHLPLAPLPQHLIVSEK